MTIAPTNRVSKFVTSMLYRSPTTNKAKVKNLFNMNKSTTVLDYKGCHYSLF